MSEMTKNASLSTETSMITAASLKAAETFRAVGNDKNTQTAFVDRTSQDSNSLFSSRKDGETVNQSNVSIFAAMNDASGKEAIDGNLINNRLSDAMGETLGNTFRAAAAKIDETKSLVNNEKSKGSDEDTFSRLNDLSDGLNAISSKLSHIVANNVDKLI